MVTPRPSKFPLAFRIRIAPRPRGFDASTDPVHPHIESTVAEVLRGRVAIRTDEETVITARVADLGTATADQPIAPRIVRNGLLQLARVGAEELREAHHLVQGYLYDAVVSAVLGSLAENGVPPDVPPAIEIDDGPIPQLRVMHGSWWRDVRHVVVADVRQPVIRLRGLPLGTPFAAWANARILSACRARIARRLGVPVSALTRRALARAC